MSALLSDVDTPDSSSLHVIVNQSHLNFTDSFNGTANPSNNIMGISDEMMRWLFLTVVIITIVICVTICLTACICICLKRRHKSQCHENKDQLLQEESIRSTSRTLSKKNTNNFSTTNGNRGPPTQHTIISPTKSVPNAFYYDNLDDIPFIDESRPTSVVDITQV